MADSYSIDLTRFDLAQFRRALETKDVLPSRTILLEEMGERFAALEAMGIATLADVRSALSTKAKREAFAQESGLPLDYLVILRREANSYVSRPVRLDKLPGVDAALVARLAAAGVKQTKHLLQRARTEADRAALAEEANVPAGALLALVKLADLTRISGVGPAFARVLCDAGIESPAGFLAQPVDDLLARAHATPGGQALTEKDIAYCLQTARLLPQAVDYG